MGLSFRSIAQRLNIAVGTVYNTYKLFESTGNVDAKNVRRRPEKCKLDHYHQLYIVGIVLENPSMYLSEICSEVQQVTDTEVSPAMICRVLSTHGLTRKKVQHIALQRSAHYRAAFVANIAHFPKEMLVWVDETGCDKRKYGYTFRGERARCQRLLLRGKRISAIAALSYGC
jgi:transposase